MAETHKSLFSHIRNYLEVAVGIGSTNSSGARFLFLLYHKWHLSARLHHSPRRLLLHLLSKQQKGKQAEEELSLFLYIYITSAYISLVRYRHIAPSTCKGVSEVQFFSLAIAHGSVSKEDGENDYWEASSRFHPSSYPNIYILTPMHGASFIHLLHRAQSQESLAVHSSQ